MMWVMKCVLLLFGLFYFIKCAQGNTYNNWIDVNSNDDSSSLPFSDYGMAVGYDYLTRTTLLIGGWTHPVQITAVKDDKITDFGSFDNYTYLYRGFGQFYTQIPNDDTIYMIDGKNGNHLIAMTISVNVETLFFDFDVDAISIPINVGTLGCLTSFKHGVHSYIVLLGGYHSNNEFLDSVQIYDIEQNQWFINTPSMNEKRRSLSCISDDNFIYAIGGKNDSDSYSDSVEKLYIGGGLNEITNQQWTYIDDTLSQTIMRSRVVKDDTNIIVIGGCNSPNCQITPYVSDVNVINTITNTISVEGGLQYGIHSTAAIHVDDKIYAFGGYSASGGLSSWQYIDLHQSYAFKNISMDGSIVSNEVNSSTSSTAAMVICAIVVIFGLLLSLKQLIWIAPLIFSFQIFDFLSDINFAANIFLSPFAKKSDIVCWCAVGCISFIIIPYITNLLHAVRIRKNAVIRNNKKLQDYFEKNLSVFMLFVILSGGCYPSLLMISSRISDLKTFKCGLSKSELFKLSKIKIRSTITLQNLPQIIIQIIYAVISPSISIATYLAFISSMISIIIAFTTYYSIVEILMVDEEPIAIADEHKFIENVSMNLDGIDNDQHHHYNKHDTIKMFKNTEASSLSSSYNVENNGNNHGDYTKLTTPTIHTIQIHNEHMQQISPNSHHFHHSQHSQQSNRSHRSVLSPPSHDDEQSHHSQQSHQSHHSALSPPSNDSQHSQSHHQYRQHEHRQDRHGHDDGQQLEHCGDFGREQSPINIMSTPDAETGVDGKTVVMKNEDFEENALKILYPDKMKHCTILNNGHTVQINIAPENKCILCINNKKYTLKQFHFHTPSEHLVDSKQHEMEMHLVHINEENEICVLAFMFTTKQKKYVPKLKLTDSRKHLTLDVEQTTKEIINNSSLHIIDQDKQDDIEVTDDDLHTDDDWDDDEKEPEDDDSNNNKGNNFLSQFWDKLPLNKTKNEILLRQSLSFDYLFETSSSNFSKNVKTNEILINMELFQYMGSLTTPPYTEGVQWLVSKKTHFINNKQLKKLSSCWKNQNNARSVQKYHGRTVSLRSKISLI